MKLKDLTIDMWIALVFVVLGIIAFIVVFILGEVQGNNLEDVGSIFSGLWTALSGGYFSIRAFWKKAENDKNEIKFANIKSKE